MFTETTASVADYAGYSDHDGVVHAPDATITTDTPGFPELGHVNFKNDIDKYVYRSMAAFAQVLVPVTPQFRVMLGGRITDDKKTEDAHTGLVYPGPTLVRLATRAELQSDRFTYKLGVEFDAARESSERAIRLIEQQALGGAATAHSWVNGRCRVARGDVEQGLAEMRRGANDCIRRGMRLGLTGFDSCYSFAEYDGRIRRLIHLRPVHQLTADFT